MQLDARLIRDRYKSVRPGDVSRIPRELLEYSWVHAASHAEHVLASTRHRANDVALKVQASLRRYWGAIHSDWHRDPS